MDPFVFSALTRVTSISTSDRARLFLEEERLAHLGAGRIPPGLDSQVSKAVAKLDWDRCRAEDEAAVRDGVRILAWPDPRYPALLREIPDPPPALYLRGAEELFGLPAVGVVGSRLSTGYGQNVARMLGEDLARAGCLVVSGMARGIDRAAHEGALAAGGRTLAVLGTGIDVIYPRENEDLRNKILERGGAVVTENPPGTPPLPRHFPIRNRILAGVCWGVVVVEATERSGSLVTARFALETGREVFAIPQNITSRTGLGPNTLIKRGAKLVQGVQDIFEEMPGELSAALAASPALPAPQDGTGLSPEAGRLLAALAPDAPKTVDLLCAETGLPVPAVLAHLLALRMAGLATELPGMRYARASARP